MMYVCILRKLPERRNDMHVQLYLISLFHIAQNNVCDRTILLRITVNYHRQADAGRCRSADAEAHNWLNLIPHSVLTGQASGTAAALAVRHGIQSRDVNILCFRHT